MTGQPQGTPITQAPEPTLAEARQISDDLMDVMNQLLAIIEKETTFVRAGNIREAIALEKIKTEMSRRYVKAIIRLKSNPDFFVRAEPELFQALHRNHDLFRTMLQINLTVLATASAVSEGLIRGVHSEVQEKQMPQTYTAAGRRTLPNPRYASPLAVSRVL